MLMCSETSPPRLSFSHDLSELQVLPLIQDVHCRDTLLLDSNPEFEFSTSSILEFESSSADELFSNGVILPTQIQDNKTTTPKHSHHVEPPHSKLPPRPSPSVDKMKKETIRELMIDVSANGERKKSSFWGFSRSKSLNCDDTKKIMVCPLPLLSRSNSMGSVANSKRMSSNKAAKSSSSSYSYPMQKSTSGKTYGGSFGNGHWVSPVLNVPTPCVSKGSSNLFGLGSFLRVGKVKRNKK